MGDTPIFWFNPRGQAFDTRDYDGGQRTSPLCADRSSLVTRRSGVANAHTGFSQLQTLGDMAWAGNEMLWDRYFFSGMNWGAATLPLTGAQQAYATHDAAVGALIAADSTAKHPLMNPRMIPFDPAFSSTRRDELKDYSKIAAHLAVEGGFNVNSTSERAWRAVFSTLRAATIQYAENGSVRTQKADNAFSRFTIPSAKASSLWEGGFHNLSDPQIDALAKAMVEQVRERGPFMGLADFVNRRLDNGKGSAGTDVGVLGALQAAIEKAGLNDRSQVSNPATASNLEHRNYQVAGSSKSFSTYVGTPGYVMQADILSTLGSNLRARSDTFVIRSYGESRDTTGKVLARAWCEATVQRTPQWTTPTDIEPTLTDPSYSGTNPAGDIVVRPWRANPAFPAENKKFGRIYQLIDFRWLNSSEI